MTVLTFDYYTLLSFNSLAIPRCRHQSIDAIFQKLFEHALFNQSFKTATNAHMTFLILPRDDQIGFTRVKDRPTR